MIYTQKLLQQAHEEAVTAAISHRASDGTPNLIEAANAAIHVVTVRLLAVLNQPLNDSNTQADVCGDLDFELTQLIKHTEPPT